MDFINITSNQTSNDTGTDATKAVMKQVSSILLIVLLAVIMMSLGATIHLDQLLKQIKKPVPAIVGMVLQFIVFPLMVFGMAYAFQLNQYDSLGMLLIGTCPGGSLSNLITYWSSGDVVLSICMTSASTTIAIGMMPLNLFIYSRAFTSKSLNIPYSNIVIGLVLILVPVAIGMLILRKLPRLAAVIVKIGGVLGFLFILIVIGINLYLYPEMFQADWKLWCAGALLPTVGLLLGYFGGRISCLSRIQCRTIGIEVSSQNVALCLTLVFVSFSVDDATKVAMFPLVFGLFDVLLLTLFAIGCRIALHSTKQEKDEGDVKSYDVQCSDIKQPNYDSDSNVVNIQQIVYTVKT